MDRERVSTGSNTLYWIYNYQESHRLHIKHTIRGNHEERIESEKMIETDIHERIFNNHRKTDATIKSQ